MTNLPKPVALKIGMLTPPTGLLTDAGTAQQRGVQAALDDINGGGGIGGKNVEIVNIDQKLGASASSALPDLVAAGANTFIGPVSSNEAADVIPALAGSKLLACSASATAPNLTTLDTAKLFFRTAMPDQYLISRLVTEITNRLTPEQTVTIVARDDDYGASFGGGLADSLTALDRPVSLFNYPAAATSFGDLPQRVAKTNPTLIVLVTLAEGPLLVSGLVGAGITPDKMLGLDGMFDPRIASRAFPSDPKMADGLSVIATTGSRALFDRLIADNADAPILYVSQAYDCAVSLALAAVVAGSADPTALAQAMVSVTGGGVKCTTFADCLSKFEAGEDIDYDGQSGPIAFDESGNPSAGRFTLAKVSGGKLTEGTTEDVNLTRNALIDAHEEAITSAVFTTSVQQALALLGFYTGPIDGIWDDDVTAAVKAFQKDAGLPETGEFDAATAEALQTRIGTGKSTLTESTTALQVELTALGFYTGPIDGRYTKEVVDAVKALQKSIGAPETGVIDIDTLRAAFAKGESSVPTTTAPPSTNGPTTTATATTTAPTTATTAPPESTSPPTTEAPATLLSTLEANPDFSEFVGLIYLAGVQAEFSTHDPSTLFAPTNEAIDPSAIPGLATAAAVKQYLHPGQSLKSGDLTAGLTLATANGGGQVLTIGGAAPDLTVDGVPIKNPEIAAGSSTIHPISGILPAS